MKISLSVVVLTHNDETRIVDCLECLGFADELIVVDDNSTDRTVELAKQFTSKIFTRALNGNFSNQRNFALNNVHSQWVLFVDSDELLSKNLKEEIVEAINSREYAGFNIKRFDYIWGRKVTHGELSRIKLLRLAKRNEGKWHGKIHETWKVVGAIGELNNPILHVPHQNIKEFLTDIDSYSSVRAMELQENNQKTSFLGIVSYPLAKFIQNYLIRQGYKDGIPGILYAIMMSFHSFLVRAKLYQLQNG